ncbi:hypothetical protein V8C44DRAFT_317777 [Trichoderma aethiopicum]
MQAIASPTKRRAVLGSLDANAAMSTEPAKKVVVAREDGPALLILTPSALLASSDNSTPAVEGESAGGKKRGVEDDGEDVVDGSPAAKKACVDGSTRSSSPSVETSSLFDSSTMTTTTTTTEPTPATRPRALTREQAREKAEILRLRLGLAGYKLRTGQTSVPLSELKHKPLPPPSTNLTRRRANTCTSAERTSAHNRVGSVESITRGVPGLSSQESTASDGGVSVVASSQESVVAETRGNTPALDGGDAAGERDKGGLLLVMGDVDSPASMFQSSPVPAPVSSLRSTCA